MRRNLLIFLFAITLISACQRGDRGTHPDGSIKFRFEYNDPYTKGATQVDENEISDINILIYDTEGKLAHSLYAERPEGEVSVGIFTGRGYTVYSIANQGDFTSLEDIATESGLNALYATFSTPEDLINGDGTIPMSGKIDTRIYEDGDAATLKLTRMLSKFRVTLDKSDLDTEIETFDIIKVRLRNLNTKVGYFYNSKATSAEDVLSEGESREVDDLTNIFSTGIDFYLPENMQGDLLPDNTDQKSHIPPEDYMGLCTYIEFTVKYRSDKAYDNDLIYRYYLHDGRFLDNFDVARNTMYTCTTTFTGSGINEVGWRIDASSLKKFVTSITVTPSSHTFLSLNQTKQFSANVLPTDAETNSVTWSSSNTSVATVDNNGLVTSVGDGTCSIIASANDDSGVSGSASVTVDSYTYPESVTISPTSAELYIGENIQLTATVLPENANNKGVTWSSDDANIATVDNSGMVTAIGEGECKITATTIDKGLTSTIPVTVKGKSFSIDEIPILYPNYNTPYTVTHSAAPAGTPEYTLEKISGEDCLTLSGATLTATYNGTSAGGEVAKYKLKSTFNGIEVTEDISVSLGSISAEFPSTMVVGIPKTGKISSKSPSDVAISWISSDETVATTDNNGKITPLKEGSVTITAKTITGAHHSGEISIINPTLSAPSQLTVHEGETKAIELTVTPAEGGDYIEWSVTSGGFYASVDNSGNLTGISQTSGYDVTIRATYTLNTDIYAEISVKVLPALTLSISGEKMLNTNISTSSVEGYPTSRSLSVTTSYSDPVEWCIYNSAEEPITGTDLFDISASHILTAKNGASGVYYIQAKCGEYYSEKVKVDVYLYLEYTLSASFNSFDKAKDEITGDYEIFTQWSDPSWSILSTNSDWLHNFTLDPLYKILKIDDGFGYGFLSGTDNERELASSMNPFFFYYNNVSEPYPENNIGEHISPSSTLKTLTGSATSSGLEGIAISVDGVGSFYIRQSGVWGEIETNW